MINSFNLVILLMVNIEHNIYSFDNLCKLKPMEYLNGKLKLKVLVSMTFDKGCYQRLLGQLYQLMISKVGSRLNMLTEQ